MKKRISCFVLALTILFSLVPTFAAPASAATSSNVASSLKAYLPIVTYAMPLSGASRVYSYSDSSLRTRTTGYYIDAFTDQIVITQISSDGRAVYVTYPSRSSRTGVRSRWFAADDILGLAVVSIQKYTFSAKSTTYRMRSASGLTSYGSISKGDSCLMLGKRSICSTTYCVYAYPISRGTYNKVSGVRYKLALCATAPAASSASSTTTSQSTNLSYALYKSTGGRISCGYDGYVNTKGRHEGIDFVKGYGSSVYSLTDGVVIRVTEGYNGSNGLSTIAIYSASTNKTVIYLHTNPENSLYVGQTITRGQKIATEAWRGCSSSSGTHTHVEVRNGRKTSAAVSVGDYTLSNTNPTSFWTSQGYKVK